MNNVQKWMALALEQAQLALKQGEVPVGALVVQQIEVGAKGPSHGVMFSDAPSPCAKSFAPHGPKKRLSSDVPSSSLSEVCIASAHNRTEQLHMATRHAELEAIEAASRHLGRWRLPDCVLYTTLEPCVMCMGASVAARLRAVIYGAADERRGGGFLLRQPAVAARFNHQLSLIGPVEPRGGELLRQFFAAKRNPTS